MTDDWAIDWDTALAGFEQDEPAPAGEYTVRVDKAEPRKAKSAPHSPMIYTELVIVGGPYDGKRVFNNIVAKPGSEASQKMFIVNLVKFGIPKAWLDQRPPGAAIAEQLIGKVVTVELSIKELDRGPTNNVEKIKSTASTTPGVEPSSTGTVPAPPLPPVPPPVAPSMGAGGTVPAAPPPPPVAPPPIAASQPLAPPVVPVPPAPTAPVAPTADVPAAAPDEAPAAAEAQHEPF